VAQVIWLEWLGLVVATTGIVSFLYRRDASFWAMGLVLVVATVLFFIVPSMSGAVTNSTF
jgi:hypothetical protein